MIDRGIAAQSLEIFNQRGRVKYIHRPDAEAALNWLQSLDGEQIVELVLSSPESWLTIGVFDDEVSVFFADWSFNTCQTTILSRQEAAEMLLEFLQCREDD